LAKLQSKKNRYIERGIIVVPLLIIIYIVFDYSVLGLINLQRERPVQFISVNTFAEYNMGLYPQLHTNNQGIFLSTREGIFAYNLDGSLRWELEYSITNPIFIGEGNFVGLAELMGHTMHIVNAEGVVFSKIFEHPILTFTVNSAGFSAVILEDGDGYIISVYDELGNTLMHSTFQENNIFPTSIAVSNNGRMLAVGFLDINDMNIGSNVLFSHVDPNQSSNYMDGIFGVSARKEGQIIGNLKFMADNRLAVVATNGITVINTNREQLLNVEWTIEFSGNTTHIVFPSNRMITTVYDDGTIKFYNLSGELTGIHSVDTAVTYISAGLDNVIVGVGNLNRRFYAINNRGTVLWEHRALQDVNQLLFLNHVNRVVLSSSINAQILERGQQPLN